MRTLILTLAASMAVAAPLLTCAQEKTDEPAKDAKPAEKKEEGKPEEKKKEKEKEEKPKESRGSVTIAGKEVKYLAKTGMMPLLKATTTDCASGNRFAGSFSSIIMMQRARSIGMSGCFCSTGVGISDRCFTSIDGVFGALNGSSPHAIWYPTTPSE